VSLARHVPSSAALMTSCGVPCCHLLGVAAQTVTWMLVLSMLAMRATMASSLIA
jgi:hypothetical protein